jgi:site-specific DNA-methyltransferase (adenine-specific)/modification methylase
LKNKVLFEGPNFRVQLYLGDCKNLIFTLPPIDSVIVDPPYGMNLNTDFSGINGWSGKGHKYERIIGDDRPFDPKPWLKFGKTQILWGAQYFCHSLPENGGWLVFNKRGSGKSSEVCFGDCELAWCNIGQSVRMFSKMWHGVARWSSEGRLHPMQKPVALMSWCLDIAKVKAGQTVLDPYMGSGTTGIACVRRRVNFIGIEKDTNYFEVAVKRIQQEMSRGNFGL